MNTHPGNGRQGNPEDIRTAIQGAISSEAEMYQALHDLHGDEKAPEVAGVEMTVPTTPENIVTDEDKAHMIEWETPEIPGRKPKEAPLAAALEDSAPAAAAVEAPNPTVSPVERPQTEEEKEAQKKIEAMGRRLAGERQSQEASSGKFEALKKRLEIMGTATRERAEKSGAYTLEKTRDVGEWYKKQPLSKKLLVSAGLLGLASGGAALGGAAGAGIATAAFTGSALQRVLGGAATFIAAEGVLKASSEAYKKGEERTPEEKKRHTIEALALAVLVGGGVVGHAAGNISHDIAKLFNGTPDAKPANPLYSEYVVPPGGTVWKAIEQKLNTQEGFDILSAEQKAAFMNTLKNKLAAMSPAELKAIGISSGDINTLTTGEKINLAPIFQDDKLLAHAATHMQQVAPNSVAPTPFEYPEEGPQPAQVIENSPEKNPVPAQVIENQFNKQSGLTPGSSERPISWNNNGSAAGRVEAHGGTTPGSGEAPIDWKASTVPYSTEMPHNDITNETPAVRIPKSEIFSPYEKMPQNIVPASPEVLAEANKTLQKDLDGLFGRRGFYTFGGNSGVDSAHWKDPKFGFANKTVADVMDAASHPNPSVSGAGIANHTQTLKMKEYLDNVRTYSHLNPAPGEKVSEYIKRAAIAVLQQQK